METNKALNVSELANYDFLIMIDKSGSMTTKDCPGGKSRWAYCQEYATSIARQCEEFDSNGIDVIVFAASPKLYEGVTASKVEQVFKENNPSGATDTAAALKMAFDLYNQRKAAGTGKPMIIVCITDGEPTDQKAVDRAIVTHSNSLTEDGETGITFIQIGKDEAARKFLEHLDNDLQSEGAKFDIVDTKNAAEMENMSIEEVLLAAIND